MFRNVGVRDLAAVKLPKLMSTKSNKRAPDSQKPPSPGSGFTQEPRHGSENKSQISRS